MKFRISRDRDLRLNYFINELYIIAFKFFIYNQLLRASALFFFNLMNFNFFHDFLASHSKAKMFNYCVQTGRARGVISFFGLSRLSFRELAVRGSIAGVRRAIW